jgi:hypothetical protein
VVGSFSVGLFLLWFFFFFFFWSHLLDSHFVLFRVVDDPHEEVDHVTNQW